ncbi:hypothetical protein K490DRAFT_75097 [Saccharata proteae CBS 121410]|uniref:DUF4484 domain-containing protein n=1 Tax=Saccharata proteae CBS 121410 TaxID=1314787 RepID=A0A9P4HUE1_9PEZI|nr:hypothetical protein K490DRAFT_75097 [Saccharata proteae CBS 121410]
MSATDATAHQDLPPLAALFLIKFDLKVGYTIAWKRSVDGLDLDRAAVDFKSLPSGLHTVQEDLVYFVHEQYVGLSAFVRGPASEEERNAHFVAVGILVPVSHGRLGRGWLHAQKLREHARILASDEGQTAILEAYWEEHVSNDKADAESPEGSPAMSGKSTGLTSLTDLRPSQDFLGAMHPALSIMTYIDTFGPLIFPLQRAALLRKRVLFLTSAPVRLACEFVYDLCILSSIPSSVDEVLPEGCENLCRLRSLFAIGVHDIPFLQEDANKYNAEPPVTAEDSDSEPEDWSPGWAACTTDGILASKSNLYDVIVELPAAQEHTPQTRRWPKAKHADGTEIKATQRDLRRFRILHHELKKMHRRTQIDQEDSPESTAEPYHDDEDENDSSPLLSPQDRNESNNTTDDEELDTNALVEPMTWSALAYTGFMWWASAGERDSTLSEEADRDRALLGDMSDFIAMSPHPQPRDTNANTNSGINAVEDATMAQSWYAGAAAPHTALIAYFHRLTGEMFNTLADVVEGVDEAVEAGEGVVDDMVRVHGEDVTRMGLDVWSEADRAFVRDVLELYWGRRAEVHGASVECCGIKIC